MTSWSEVVTTALLGTGRRAVPTDLPPWAASVPATGVPAAESRILDLAAAHRAAARSGSRPTMSQATAGPTAVPPQRLGFAPAPARQLLSVFLSRSDGTTTNLWLAACVRFGFGLAPEHWAPLVALASRSTTYDRGLLAFALGERGRWFVHQNPAWLRLANTLDQLTASTRPAEPPASSSDPSSDSSGGSSSARPVDGHLPTQLPTTEQVQADPELLLAVPDPWPDVLVRAAYVGLVGGRMGGRARSYARALGSRLSPAQYAALGAGARTFLEPAHLTPAARRGVRALFVEIERAGFERAEIDRAFAPSVADFRAVGSERILRVSIPPV